MKTLVGLIGVSAEILTVHLSNVSQKRYLFSLWCLGTFKDSLSTAYAIWSEYEL
jgi:hypothetical protein